MEGSVSATRSLPHDIIEGEKGGAGGLLDVAVAVNDSYTTSCSVRTTP